MDMNLTLAFGSLRLSANNSFKVDTNACIFCPIISGVRGQMKIFWICIIFLAYCSPLRAESCAKEVIGLWKTIIPAVNDKGERGNRGQLPDDADLLIRYKEDGTFGSVMKGVSEPKYRFMFMMGTWACENNNLTVTITEVNDEPVVSDSTYKTMTIYELRNIKANTFDNYQKEIDTTFRFVRLDGTLKEQLEAWPPP